MAKRSTKDELKPRHLSKHRELRALGVPSDDPFYKLADENAFGLIPNDHDKSAMSVLTQTIVIEAIRRGHVLSTAAAMAGLNPRTVNMWLHKGMVQDATTPCGKFLIEFKRAEGKSQELLMEKLIEVGQDDWRSYAWLLSRRYRDWQDSTKPTLEQQDQMFEVKLEKAKAEVDLIKAKTHRLLREEGDPLQELLAIISENEESPDA